MQLVITFRPQEHVEVTLPIHYGSIVQGFIYHCLDDILAKFLHDQGYCVGKRRFKLFSFSRLLGKYELDTDRREILFCGGCKLVISSPIQEVMQSLANGLLLKRAHKLGKNAVEITEVAVRTQQVDSERVVVSTLSPVVTYSTFTWPDGRKYTCYFSPKEGEFDRLITGNLKKKYEALYEKEAPEGQVRVETRNRLKMNVVNYKGTFIKGYSGRLQLYGPTELLQMAVDAGLGSKNSQGFGCLKLIK